MSDIEIRKGEFGALMRVKAWFDEALEDGKVRARQPGQQLQRRAARVSVRSRAGSFVPPLDGQLAEGAVLSDEGFEKEQKFSNAMLLDAYVYGTFDVGDTDLQLRLGRQVVNWGESVFIQGVNQINPIDVPAARRPGTELKEVLLPVGMAYVNWGFSFGLGRGVLPVRVAEHVDRSDAAPTGRSPRTTSRRTRARCNSATVITQRVSASAFPARRRRDPQLGSNVFAQANGLYVPLVEGKDASDNGQFGLAFRIPGR